MIQGLLQQLDRLLALLLICLVALQLYFLASTTFMAHLDPLSTTFVDHQSLRRQAIQQARTRNDRPRAQVTGQAPTPAAGCAAREPERLLGGSTVTQQLAKNLFRSGERTYWHKGQEALIAWALEPRLSKSRIPEIYLNAGEWNEGVCGARAAGKLHFGLPPQQLQAWQAARHAVMLPAPRRFEGFPESTYLAKQFETTAARMPAVKHPPGYGHERARRTGC